MENFPVSGEPIPPRSCHWLARIKGEAAQRERRSRAARPPKSPSASRRGRPVAAGEHDDQFPIDVFQTGSGTSTNMNVNEVIASNLAGEGVHPNDHVNMGQSSTTSSPAAVHLLRSTRDRNDLLPALDEARGVARAKARSRRHRQDRSHAHDGRRPGHARSGVRRLRRAGALGERARRRDARAGLARSRSAAPRSAPVSTRIPSSPPRCARGLTTTPACRSRRRSTTSKRRPPRRAGRALGRAQGARRRAHQDREQPAPDGLRTAGRARRDRTPELQKGSSIMPGKVTR